MVGNFTDPGDYHYVIKCGNGEYYTGDFDRCYPPNLYIGPLNEAAQFDSLKQAENFIETWNLEGVKIEKLLKPWHLENGSIIYPDQSGNENHLRGLDYPEETEGSKIAREMREVCNKLSKEDRAQNLKRSEYFIKHLMNLKSYDCCANLCRDWRETRGFLPPSDHTPGCKNYKEEKFHKISVFDKDKLISECIVEINESEDFKKELEDNEMENNVFIREVYMTRDQYEKLDEFQGF